MSRSTYDVKELYVGTGSVSAYTFDFKIEALAQLLIIETDASNVETQRVLGTDAVYLSSVTFDAVDGGGTVNLTANLPTNYNLIILLANDLPTQLFEFRNKTTFSLPRFESALDAIAGAVQRLSYIGKQAFRIHDLDDETTFNSQLPAGVAGNPNKTIIINSLGTGVEFGPDAATIASAEAEAIAAAASAAAALVSENAAAADLVLTNADVVAAAASAAAAASSASSAVGLIWIKTTTPHTDFQTAALENTIELYSLAAKRTIHALIIKHSTAFVGTGITAYKISIGITGEEDKFVSLFDVLQAVGDSAKDEITLLFFGSLTLATSIKIKVVAVGANLDQSSAGSVDVYTLERALP